MISDTLFLCILATSCYHGDRVGNGDNMMTSADYAGGDEDEDRIKMTIVSP